MNPSFLINLVFFSVALTVLGLAPAYVSIPWSFVDVLLKTDESSTAGQSLVQVQHPLLSPLSFCWTHMRLHNPISVTMATVDSYRDSNWLQSLNQRLLTRLPAGAWNGFVRSSGVWQGGVGTLANCKVLGQSNVTEPQIFELSEYKTIIHSP